MIEGGNEVLEGGAIQDFKDRDALVSWCWSLKALDGRAAARAIYASLKQAKVARLSVRGRFEFLELLGAPVADVLANLHKYYWNVQFPLPQRTLAAAAMADDLCEMLINGYQSVLREIHAGSVGGEGGGQFSGLWQIVAHRILHYSQRIITNRALLNTEGRINVWLRVNKLFITAIGERLHGQLITFEGVPGYPVSTIEQLYRRILLLSLVPLHALRKNQIQECLDTLEVWGDALATKRCTTDYDRARMPFQVDPGQDRGPYPSLGRCIEEEGGRSLLLDTGKLQNLLNQSMLQAAQVEQERICLGNGAFIGISTLEQLKAAWRERPQRGDQRIQPLGRAEIDVLISLNELHHVLRGDSRPDREGAPEPASASAVTEGQQAADEAGGGAEPRDAQQIDPWQGALGGGNYHFHKATLKDRSANGYGLEIRITDVARVLVGDLIGVRIDTSHPITLGVVRWIRQDEDHSLSCGLLLIGEELYPASLAPEQSGSEIPCVIAKHHRNHKTMLVLDYFPLLRNKWFVLHFQQQELPIAFVGWPVEESRTFEAFEFGLRSGEENAPDADRPLLTIEALLAGSSVPGESASEVGPVATDVVEGDEEGYDENLWRID